MKKRLLDPSTPHFKAQAKAWEQARDKIIIKALSKDKDDWQGIREEQRAEEEWAKAYMALERTKKALDMAIQGKSMLKTEAGAKGRAGVR